MGSTLFSYLTVKDGITYLRQRKNLFAQVYKSNKRTVSLAIMTSSFVGMTITLI